jgi:hypothetical protein
MSGAYQDDRTIPSKQVLQQFENESLGGNGKTDFNPPCTSVSLYAITIEL